MRTGTTSRFTTGPSALQRGFATYGSDSGHKTTDSVEWARNVTAATGSRMPDTGMVLPGFFAVQADSESDGTAAWLRATVASSRVPAALQRALCCTVYSKETLPIRAARTRPVLRPFP